MSVPAEPLQMRAHAKKALIREAALAHLRAVGVRQFSTGVVARTTGISVGVIYRYFADSEALIEDVAPGACRAWEKLEQVSA